MLPRYLTTWFPFATALAVSALMLAGCGTTRSSDTNRTATEQLLISDAIDRAIQSVELDSLAGQTVFLDDSKLTEIVDRNYLISTLRQHLLANGCMLRDKREEADFVVEARAGAIGTDRNDLLFGVPSMNVPQIMPMQPTPAAIPEIPIAKRRDQRGIAKIAVFAYHRESGEPVWQSGIAHQESSANDVWILGAGPFQRGTIYEGTEFAGKALHKDDAENNPLKQTSSGVVKLDREKTFSTPAELAKRSDESASADHAVTQASTTAPPASADAAPKVAAAPSPATPPDASAAAPPMGAPDVAQASTQSHPAKFEQTIPEFNRPLSDYLSPKASADSGGEISASIYQRPLIKRTGSMTVDAALHAPDDLTPLPEPKIEGP